jgi:hypothetical protein
MQLYTWTSSRIKDETNSNIEFLQPHSVVAADALIEIGTAVIPAVFSLDEHLSQAKLLLSRNSVTFKCIAVLCGTSMSEYKLLNDSRTAAANNFDANQCSIMNTCSAREYTMFAPAQLLLIWSEQRPSIKGDLDSSVTGTVGRVYYTWTELLVISFLYRSAWLFLGCVLNGTLCIIRILNYTEKWNYIKEIPTS